MTRGTWPAIGVGTLIAALGLWFGLFAVQTSRMTGVAIISIGIIFAMYGMVAFSGVDDPGTVAFHSALYAIVTASMFVVLFTVTESPSYVVAAPTMAIGVGGAIGLPPEGNPFRTLTRVAGAALVTVIVVLVYWVDHTVFALIAPLVTLPSVGLADRMFDRGTAVVAEPTD
ncbi:MAG: hypothetical protein DRJ28_03420 [Actinobacteria bacterium]|nr:MAG: hypothetical protein DRJ28_03420 [Actinomycetota bacterium]